MGVAKSPENEVRLWRCACREYRVLDGSLLERKRLTRVDRTTHVQTDDALFTGTHAPGSFLGGERQTLFVVGRVQPCACKAFTRLRQAIGTAKASVCMATLLLFGYGGPTKVKTICKNEHPTAFLHNGGTNLIAQTGDDTIRSGEKPHLDTHTWK